VKKKVGGGKLKKIKELEKCLEEVVKFLKKEKKTLVLKKIENQYGEMVAESFLEWKDDDIYLHELNCYSSNILGLGTCQCVSHPTYVSFPVSAIEFFEHILQYLQENIEHIKARSEELEEIEKISKELVEKIEKIFGEIKNGKN